MANTITHNGLSFEIVPDGSSDWLYSTYYTAGMRLHSIQFIGTAANDRLIVRDKGIDGAAIFDSGALAAADTLIKYYNGKKAYPVIDASDCTFGTPANCKIIIEYL